MLKQLYTIRQHGPGQDITRRCRRNTLFLEKPTQQNCVSHRVHIVGQRANRYIVPFHIAISRYHTIFTASVQRQMASRPRVRRTVECAVLSAVNVCRVMPQAHTDHCGRSPATASAAAANRNRDGSASATSKRNSHCSDAGKNGTFSVCFNFFPLYIKLSFTHRAKILPAAPPQAHTRHSTHNSYGLHSCHAQTANHPRHPTIGRPPTIPTPLACPDTGVPACISCDDNAGKWSDRLDQRPPTMAALSTRARWRNDALPPSGHLIRAFQAA